MGDETCREVYVYRVRILTSHLVDNSSIVNMGNNCV